VSCSPRCLINSSSRARQNSRINCLHTNKACIRSLDAPGALDERLTGYPIRAICSGDLEDMKKIALGLATATLTLMAGNAFADGLPTRYAPAACCAFSWTGFYVGVNAGGAWGDGESNSPLRNLGGGQEYIPSVVADINAQAHRSFDPSAFTGGVGLGYNIQHGSLVFGVVADFNSIRLKESKTVVANFTGFGPPVTYSDQVAANWLITTRAKLGIAAGQLLFYGTGGAAFTDLKYRHQFIEGAFAGTSNGTESAKLSETKTGWTVGGGVDYALSRNWTIGAEYLFADFGKVSSVGNRVIFPGGPGTSVFDHSAELTTNIVRANLTYKFGGDCCAAPLK
jgi:outer membrane immunogenic protein